MEPIHELKTGAEVDRVFAVSQNELKTTKNGKFYLQLQLSDRSGAIAAKKWDASPEFHEQLPAGSVVQVRGRVDEYKGMKQIIVNAIQLVPEGEVDPSSFLPASERDPDEMYSELVKLLAKVKHTELRRLLDVFFEDENLMSAFRRAPAAKGLHQAYLGGLLEHTLSLLKLGEKIYPHYLAVNSDLMRAGIFLHDVGKTRELEYERTFNYSNAGILVGHLAIGCEILCDKVRSLDGFPEELFRALEHMILSHHGKVEWGAVKIPCFAEAVLLHHLDNIDAKVSAFYEIMAEEGDTGDEWTDRKYMFDNTRLWKGVHRGRIDAGSSEPKSSSKRKAGKRAGTKDGELPF
ncbi:MAG: HD domain-containing protein [Planctomycetota bacterium]|nr:MAG: HD domain-containing protein [Planctomycetota bacterium]